MALQRNLSRSNDRALSTYATSNSVISDQFRTIRTNLKFLPIKGKNRIILITSPDKGDGKSTTTANLAVSVAQQQEKILLIDANLRDPVIHKMFKVPNEIGLTDILVANTTFTEAVYQTNIGKLDVLPSGASYLNPVELIESGAMNNFLHTVASDYSHILIDSPSLLTFTETRVLAHLSDGVILVVHHRKTKKEQIAESRKLLELVDAKLVGAIFNRK